MITNTDRAAIREALAPVFARVDQAYVNFATLLTEIAGLDQDTAKRLTQFYVKKKLAKVDTGIGRINVKHGGYLDKEAIGRAVKIMNGEPL